jgi:signal transduction histidine kinase
MILVFGAEMNDKLVENKEGQVQIALFGVLLLLPYFYLGQINWLGSSQLHTLIEVISTGLAAVVGVIALVRYYAKPENTMLFVGVGFLGTSVFDAYHAIVTSNYFSPMLPSGLSSLIPWSWLASRFFLSLMLFLSIWLWQRDNKKKTKTKIDEKAVYGGSIGLVLVLLFFFTFFPLPRAYIPEYFIHRPEELLPAFFFILALIGYWRKGLWKMEAFEQSLIYCLVLSLGAQLVYMPFSNQVFDLEFDVAHLLKTLSYFAVFIGLMRNIYQSFILEVQSANTQRQLNSDLKGEIDERVKVEKALKAKSVLLEASNKELDSFSYSVSHDLRAPLRSLNGFSRALVEDYGDKLDDTGKDYIARILKGSKRMGDMIDQLLKLSRSVRDQIVIEKTDLSEIVEELYVELKKVDPTRNVLFNIQENVVAHCDKRLIHVVLQNLINNAWKYTGNKKQAEISFGVELDKGKKVYYVKDNGVGFDMAYADKLFIAFQRLHNIKDFEGNGIGLATVSRVISRHDGKVWAEAELGKGACFRFYFSEVGGKFL